MSDPSKSAIARTVEHHGGPIKVSALLDGTPVYQEIQRWVKRGWASPKHFLRLEPLIKPLGLTVRDLYLDIDRAKRPHAPSVVPAPEASEAPAADAERADGQVPRRRAVDRAPDAFARRNIEQAELIELAQRGLSNRRKPSRDGPAGRDERSRGGHPQNRREPHPR